MIKELIKIKENNNIVSIFCDEDDTSMFLEGYIYAIGRQDFLIKHITPHGLADGYILKKIDSVMHLEISGQYEKKSVGISTALCPYIGYAKSAEIAKKSLKTGISVKELVLE